MLRMIQSDSASHAKKYYSQSLSKSDYYIDDQELPGLFKGKLADRLEITGVAQKETFYALCENINPKTGGNLTLITRENRRVGYDLNFHCSKSVSIVHALSSDDHIRIVFEESVNETMREIEADSMTRVRKAGQCDDRHTGELAWMEVTHQTARPVDGSAPDPHLHAHCFIFNASFDDYEQQIKAGQFGDIKMNMPYFQARFNKRLSDKLIGLGYEIRATNKSFEIVGVPDSVLRFFSKRTNQIGQFAKKHGIAEPDALAELGARTRSKKQTGLSMSELKKEWRKQIAENIKFSEGEKDTPIRYNHKAKPSKMITKDCVDFSIDHSFERASVMHNRRLLANAYHHSIGNRSITLDDITTSLNNDDRIIHVQERNRNLCTTKEVLAEEKYMVQLARKGQGKFQPLYQNAPTIKLNGQQGAAIEHVLTTPHQVSIVMGAAGSGKTTLMTEAKQHINQAGRDMFVVAPTSQAARDVLVKEGFENAETVAKLLVDKELQTKLQGQVLWVDEAGLLGTKDTVALLKIANQQNARIIFGGDTRQHASILRGDSLRILNVVGKIEAAEVNKIRRQTNIHYKAAVEELAKGNIKEGFAKLDQMGAIKNIDPLKPNEELVTDYINAVKGNKTALIVSPTREQGKAVTDEVRKNLKSSGIIGEKEVAALKFESLSFTEAQKSDWRRYRPGQIIQFNQNVPQIKRGSICSVADVKKEKIVIVDAEGKNHMLPSDRANTFEVYESAEIGLSKGDQVKITRNSFDKNNKRLNNGHLLEIASIHKSGEITLINRQSKTTYTLDKDFGHIDHAYCSTSYSSQGKTVDQVLISQPASTFTATNSKQFYVSVSRGKEAVTIYTDDREKLLEYASELGDRQSALELVKDTSSHNDYVIQQQREKSLVP